MKTKELMKAISLLLAGAMTVGMLAGCGQSEVKENVDKQPESTTEKEEVQVSESTDEVDEGDLDISEPYTIDMYFQTWGAAVDDLEAVEEAMSKITKEKINADVVLHYVDQWSTNIPLEFAAGSKIDYVITSANLAPNYSTMVGSGYLLPLNDLVEKYGQGLKEVLGDFLYGAQMNGDFYAVPVNKEKGNSYGGFCFNKNMVEELDLMEEVTAIKSYKDLEPIFAVVKSKMPEVVCLSLPSRANGYSRNQYVDVYGTELGGVMPIDTTDYKLVDLWTYEPYVEAVRWTHEMYELGYVSEAVTTGDDNSYKTGNAFCFPEDLRIGKDEELTVSYGYEVMMVEVNEPYCQADQAQGVMGGIGSTSENPERAMMFMNLLYTDAELLNTFIYGVEGQHYEKVSTETDSLGNKITYIKYPEGVDSKTVGWANQGWAFGNRFLNYLMEGKDVEEWANYVKTNEQIKTSSTFGFAFDQSPVATEIAACKTVTKKYDLMNYGALDPDEVIPQMMEELDTAGYQKIKEEKQRQIDEWIAANK